MRRIVIVGGGQSGAFAASALRAEGFDGVLSLVCEEHFEPYERPPLSKAFLTGTIDTSALHVLPASFWIDHDVQLEIGKRATRILAGDGVVVGDELLRADGVILCTGATARRLSVPGAGLRGVHVLRTIEHASALRGDLISGSRLVVVGGGLIGSEVASTAAAMGVEVTVLDIASVPLARVVGEVVGRRLTDEAARNGIVSRQGSVERILGDRDVVGVLLHDGTVLDADVVVVGVGAEPCVDVAASSGIVISNGIVCDVDGRSSLANVTVAGDVANVSHGPAGRRSEHWKSAIEQGGRAARALLGIPNPPVEPSWFWSEQHGHRVEVAGELSAGRLVVRGDPESGDYSVWHLNSDSELTGAVGFNRSRDVRNAIKILANGGNRMRPMMLEDDDTPILEAVES
jgi:3-phenylpropionate/trans-cinnamate dioxygenase ferredoxin reductase subunit